VSLRSTLACFAAAPRGVFPRPRPPMVMLFSNRSIPLQWDGQGGGDQGSDAVQPLPDAGACCLPCHETLRFCL